MGYAAGVGYDEASGLGSVNADNLAMAWGATTGGGGGGSTGGSGTGTFSLGLTPATLTVAEGTSGTETITATPASGYTGTILLTLTAPSALQGLCYHFASTNGSGYGTLAIAGTAAVSTQLTIDTNAFDCTALGAASSGGAQALNQLRGALPTKNNGAGGIPAVVTFAGLLMMGCFGKYSRKFRSMAGLVALIAAGLAMSACSSVSAPSGSANKVTTPPAGTYTITVTGQDSATSSIAATRSFTLTIQ
jgi:hypothetical protein